MGYNAFSSYLGIALTSEWSGALLRQFAIILTLVGAWGACPVIPLPKLFESQAFPIYLLHCALMSFVLIGKVIEPCFALSIAGYLFNVCFLVFGSIGTSILIRKFWPKAAKIIFGGR